MSLVGNLEDLGLGEILQIVSLSRKSGVLVLHSRGREARVVFRFGQVVRASSSSFQQNLGEVLIQKGVIDLPILKQSLAIQEEEGFRERLGTILIKHFTISADSIEEVVREQIENVAYSLFAWAEGTFEFELQENVEVIDKTHMDPLQFMLDQGLNPQFLAMEGSRIIDERRHRGEPIDEIEAPAALPSAPEESVDLSFNLLQAPAPAAEAPAAGAEPEKRPLVLVDDDPSTLEALSGVLQTSGYDLFPFARSEETLIKIDTLYREGARPTVLVDLIMPRMDGSGILGGLELLELIHGNFPDLPVLALADYHNRDAERKVRDMGFSFLMKPRKSEVLTDGFLQSFSSRLLPELARVEVGGGPTEWSDKVNIGDELRLEMGEEFAAHDGAVHQSTGISLLRRMLEELNDPGLGGGIILLVLRFASEFMNRAVIFIVKRDEIAGLGQFGISDSGGRADAMVRSLRVPRGEDSLFHEVLEAQQPVKLQPEASRWNSYLLEHLGGGVPKEVFLGPIVSEGKVVAVLYGDNLPEKRAIGDTDSLEIFLSQAGIAMEKALLQRRLNERSPEGM